MSVFMSNHTLQVFFPAMVMNRRKYENRTQKLLKRVTNNFQNVRVAFVQQIISLMDPPSPPPPHT